MENNVENEMCDDVKKMGEGENRSNIVDLILNELDTGSIEDLYPGGGSP